MKGKLHSGSGPDMVGQEEMLKDGGGVGPGIEHASQKLVKKRMYIDIELLLKCFVSRFKQ